MIKINNIKTTDANTLLKELNELDFQAELFKQQRNILNAEAKKWADKRYTLNQKKRKLLYELKLLVNKLDEINMAIKKLKQHRSEIIFQINTKREKCTALNKTLRNTGKSSKSASSIKRQIRKLEWEIQTKTTSSNEENEIINQIRLLERQLLIYKDITSVRVELGELKIKSNTITTRIAELANEKREHNEKMLKMNEVIPLKNEVDHAHGKYLEYKKAASEIDRKYLETINQIKMMNAQIKKVKDAEYDKLLDKKNEMITEAAYKKLKEKKRVSLDEFKLLKMKGLI